MSVCLCVCVRLCPSVVSLCLCAGWLYRTNGDITSTPAIGPDGTVYVGTHGGTMYAIVHGVVRWTTSLSGAPKIGASAAVAHDGSVVFGSDGSRVVKVNGRSGAIVWETIVAGAIACAPAIGADGTVYIGNDSPPDDTKFQALNGGTGSVLFSRSYSTPHGHVRGGPVIGPDGSLYFGVMNPTTSVICIRGV